MPRIFFHSIVFTLNLCSLRTTAVFLGFVFSVFLNRRELCNYYLIIIINNIIANTNNILILLTKIVIIIIIIINIIINIIIIVIISSYYCYYRFHDNLFPLRLIPNNKSKRNSEYFRKKYAKGALIQDRRASNASLRSISALLNYYLQFFTI